MKKKVYITQYFDQPESIVLREVEASRFISIAGHKCFIWIDEEGVNVTHLETGGKVCVECSEEYAIRLAEFKFKNAAEQKKDPVAVMHKILAEGGVTDLPVNKISDDEFEQLSVQKSDGRSLNIL